MVGVSGEDRFRTSNDSWHGLEFRFVERPKKSNRYLRRHKKKSSYFENGIHSRCCVVFSCVALGVGWKVFWVLFFARGPKSAVHPAQPARSLPKRVLPVNPIFFVDTIRALTKRDQRWFFPIIFSHLRAQEFTRKVVKRKGQMWKKRMKR